MNVPAEFLLITSSVGAIQSGFFSVYLLSAPKRKEMSSRLLGLLLLALAVRMAKSVGYYFSNDNLPGIIENIGYAANLAIAPLLLIYIKSFIQESFIFKRYYWLYLTPSFLVLGLSPFLNDEFWLGNMHGYFWSLYYFGAHFPFIYYELFKNLSGKNTRLAKDELTWLFILAGGISLVWAAYAANFLLGLVSYITAPVIFSGVIYAISYFALRQSGIFVKDKAVTEKYKNSALTRDQLEIYAQKIKDLMSDDKIYRDSNITLPKLAKRMSVSTHIVSETVNRYFQMGFADFINSYRLKDARQMLENPQKINEKIASIASDCGYGTLSAFNTSFKKNTRMTPSEYRRKHCT